MISKAQNSKKQLRRLAAQRFLYSSAKRLLALQFVLAAPVAFVIGLLSNSYPNFAPVGAIFSIVIFLVNFFLEKIETDLKRKAALIQELFDCEVLDIDWSRFLLKPTPDLETINEYADNYEKKNDIQTLRDWYPAGVSKLPVRWGAVLCQRINCWWNTKLHRLFARISLMSLVVLIILLIYFGFNMKVADFVLVLLVPAIPFFDLSLRLWRDHSECAEEYENLKESIRRLWNSVLKKQVSDDDLLFESRMLQDQIFERRQKNPLVFNWMYWLFRDIQQVQMKMNTDEMVRTALAQVEKLSK